MKAARFVPPLLIGATLILLGANALPTVHRKHALQRERFRLEREIEVGNKQNRELILQIRALRDDPFYVERKLIETWQSVPQGMVRFDDPVEPTGLDE